MSDDRTIHKILSEAWEEIRDRHGVCVHEATFETLSQMDGRVFLVRPLINATATDAMREEA